MIRIEIINKFGVETKTQEVTSKINMLPTLDDIRQKVASPKA